MPWIAGENAHYAEGSPEATNNAMMIAKFLCGRGFSVLSASAMLGNFQHEGMMNPWYWEDRYTPSEYEASMWPPQEAQSRHGYGLIQYTPYYKYVNQQNASLAGYGPHFRDVAGLPSDGNAQLLFMMGDMHTGNWSSNQYGYYAGVFADPTLPSGPGVIPFSKDISVFYPTPVEDFIKGVAEGRTAEEKIENLTGVFELQYGAPANEPPTEADPIGYIAKRTYPTRVYSALYYYDLIKNAFPWKDTSSFKIMMYLKPNWKRRRQW